MGIVFIRAFVSSIIGDLRGINMLTVLTADEGNAPKRHLQPSLILSWAALMVRQDNVFTPFHRNSTPVSLRKARTMIDRAGNSW